MGGGVGVELLVQAADEVGAPVYVPDIAVAHQPVVGAVEVVLDDRAGEFLFQRLPHGLKVPVLILQHGVDLCRGVGGRGQPGQVAPAGMDIDHIRGESVQFRRAEHGVLPVLAVLALVKIRFDAVLQQKKAQLIRHFVGGGPAQDGDLLMQRMRVLRQKFPAQAALFAQQRFGIQRVMEAIHLQLLCVYRAASAPLSACAI